MSHSDLFPSDQNQDQPKPLEEILSPSELVLFSRINNHLLFHYVPLAQFWTTQRLCVTLDQFQKMLESIRFFKGKDQLAEMKQQRIQFIGLDKVLMAVNEWKKHEVDIPTFLQKQLIQSQTQNSNSPSPAKKKAKSKYETGQLDINSHTELKSQRNSQIEPNDNNNSRITHSTHQSNSRFYLAQTSKKQQSALLELNQTLIRTNKESQYELAIKVGEINDICKKLKNDLSYVIIHKEGGEVQIFQKSNKSDQSKLISQKMFERRYEELKTINNNMVQETWGTLEKDLRETLVEVMYLSDKLERQIGLLKRKGINS